MAKESGIGMTVTVDESDTNARNISDDITDLSFSTPRGVQEVTGVTEAGVERLLLLADFSITLNGVFDDGSNLAHEVFSTVPSSSVLRTTTIVHSSQTLNPEVFYTDYALTRSSDGSLTWTAPGVNGDGAVPTWS